MVSSLKSKTLLGLALLRELYNKVKYYQMIVSRNIRQYSEYKEKISKIEPGRVSEVEREISMLSSVDRQLNSISVFLERLIVRLETLTLAGNAVIAALTIKDVVKTLKRNMEGVPPLLSVLVDRLNEVSKSIVQELQSIKSDEGTYAIASSEALKIVEEARRVAGVK